MSQEKPYEDAFDRRAARYDAARNRQYNEANERYPNARTSEREILVDLLELTPGLEICDIAAGGGYLADGISARVNGDCRMLCVENSVHFSESLPDDYERVVCSLSELDLPNASVDRVACLAGVHHQEDKERFFAEAFRILRPGGRIAVGDVLSGSAPARFLNEAVNRWSDLGHAGLFLEHDELTRLMRNAGFVGAEERVHEYTWSVPNLGELAWFCKTLFRMTNASLAEVESEVRRYLEVDIDGDAARLHWSLVYASAVKA